MINIEKNIIKIFINKVLWLYCKIVYRVQVVGKENIPKDGGLLICGNHVSSLDAVLVNCFTPRKVRFMAKEELYKVLIFSNISS